MNVGKVIRERIRQKLAGVEVDADVNAAIAANVGEPGGTTSVTNTSTATAGNRREEEPERPPA